MKKKYLIFAAIFLLLLAIGIGIFLFLNKKNNSATEEKTNPNEKNAFINANIETNCKMEFEPILKTNTEKLNPILTESFKKYGFPVEDNETMLYILRKYEHDEEIKAIITSFSEKCKDGVPTELYEGKSLE
ncbi:MAG: hypothetical protein RBS56_02620 [Candidatus Gracilibacteria bacterium]|jgi:hypothetical protein|nr:hypothetical protein [Candidatus Gracilibacteria bacterium]